MDIGTPKQRRWAEALGQQLDGASHWLGERAEPGGAGHNWSEREECVGWESRAWWGRPQLEWGDMNNSLMGLRAERDQTGTARHMRGSLECTENMPLQERVCRWARCGTQAERVLHAGD